MCVYYVFTANDLGPLRGIKLINLPISAVRGRLIVACGCNVLYLPKYLVGMLIPGHPLVFEKML